MKRLLNGININYRFTYNSGRDKVVLLLHGWGGNLNSFRFMEKYLIENGYSIITVDFPGFGASDVPPETFSMEDYHKIILELLDAEKVEKCSIIAHSFGGRVAILLASSEPNRVEKLVLCDSAGIKPKFSLSKQFKIWKFKIMKKLKKMGIVKRELGAYGSEDYKALPEKMKPVFSRIINADLTPKLKNILAPTLIVWGKKDAETPFYMAKIINKNIKDSAIITFEEGGHFCYLDNPSKFQTIISSFLS